MTELNVNLAIKIIPEFDGNPEELHRFISCCEIIHDPLKPIEISAFLNIVKTRLKGKAYEIVKYTKFETWPQLKTTLERQFQPNRALEVIQLDLLNCKQSKGEPVRVFANRVEKLLYELNDASLPAKGDEGVRNLNSLTALRVFQEGLMESIKIIVKACRFMTLQEAVTRACDEEALLAHASSKSVISPSVSNSQSTSVQTLKCQICQKKGHSALSCYSLRSNNTSLTSSRMFVPSSSYRNQSGNINNSHQKIMMCNYCRRPGHAISECFKRQRVNQARYNANNDVNTTVNKSLDTTTQGNSQGLEKSNIPLRVRNLQPQNVQI